MKRYSLRYVGCGRPVVIEWRRVSWLRRVLWLAGLVRRL
jgi:hypothetical protein